MTMIPNNVLYWAKVRENAIIPTKRDEDAGYDIYACLPDNYGGYVIIPPHSTELIPTGIACAVSDNYYLQVQERGSTGSIGLKYGAGVIDSGYRGEILIPLTNTTTHPIIICDPYNTKNYPLSVTNNIGTHPKRIYNINKAIAQLIVLNVPKMQPTEISYQKLLEIPSERGTSKLGSTGK